MLSATMLSEVKRSYVSQPTHCEVAWSYPPGKSMGYNMRGRGRSFVPLSFSYAWPNGIVEGSLIFETSRPTWVSVHDVVFKKQTKDRPRKPSQSIPELSHFYRTQTSKKRRCLCCCCYVSLLTCHFLDTKQMGSRMLTSFCQLHKKNKNTCRHKKSLHHDRVYLFK